MHKLNQRALQNFFREAKELGHRYVAVAFQLPETPKPEVQINPVENFEAKQRYFATRYDDNLFAMGNPELRIVDYASANTYAEVEVLINGQ